jgi:hypothetical protein
MVPAFCVTLMINKLLVSVLLFGCLTACASGPATGADGFEIRRTGLDAGAEFWDKYFFEQDGGNPYSDKAYKSPFSSPGAFGSNGSFYEETHTHRERTAPIYEREASSELFKRWVLNYDNSPYGSAD